MDLVKFQLGETVYLVLSTEKPGMVTGILFRPNGVSYLVTWADGIEEKYHFDIELTREKAFASKS